MNLEEVVKELLNYFHSLNFFRTRNKIPEKIYGDTYLKK